ncbi:MAG: enolase C-terminal domain-like protein [Bosea sp. (in: a-proteobacteria)]
MENSPVLRSLTLRAVDVPLTAPLRTASGTVASAPLLLIDMFTEEGVTGRAYLFAYHAFALRPLADLVRTLFEPLIGRAVEPAAMHAEMARRLRLLGVQGLAGMALSGIDMALWDMAARAKGQALASFLGHAPKPIRAYASIGMLDMPADESQLEALVEKGFTAIKFRLGGPDWQAEVETVREVRAMLGGSFGLMVDFNQSQPVAQAKRRLADLAQFNLIWAEEPVLADDLAASAEVRKASPVPIQSGENWWMPEGFASAIAVGASDMLMPDLMKAGGITGWLRITEMAAAHELPIASHLLQEASAHVLAATPTASWIEYLDLAGPILRQSAQLIDGKLMATGPGIGLEWDKSAVARFAV